MRAILTVALTAAIAAADDPTYTLTIDVGGT